jgi:hypothetical protein
MAPGLEAVEANLANGPSPTAQKRTGSSSAGKYMLISMPQVISSILGAVQAIVLLLIAEYKFRMPEMTDEVNRLRSDVQR